MSDDGIIFIPKKRRFNEPVQEGRDVAPEPVESSDQLESKRVNVMVTCYLAMTLYLHPKYVYATALYWISQYVNYAKRSPVAWFTDHIERLLRYPATLAITSSNVLSHHHARQMKQTVLLRFAGSPLHAVPNEYYLALRNQLLTECLIHLTYFGNEAFMTRRHRGLKAELEFDCFCYDRVLNYFYEPGFFVLSSYVVYVRYLFHQSGGRDMSDFTPILTRIAAPLRQMGEPGCLLPENSNYKAKREALFSELDALYRILDQGTSPEEIEQQLDALWEEKATYCNSVQPERYLHIHKQVYGQQ